MSVHVVIAIICCLMINQLFRQCDNMNCEHIFISLSGLLQVYIHLNFTLLYAASI